MVEIRSFKDGTMARRHLSMRPEWEGAIREGRKSIDARLVADDIANVKVGSIIRYPGARVRVTHMRFYAGLNDLLAHEDWRRIAPDAADAEQLRRLLEEGHEASAHRRGAVAIEFEATGAAT
jgi:ASC-1-like (ASCH) protein